MATPPGKIALEIRAISDLRPHEETVRGLSERLSAALVRDGVQRDPVVIDGVSGTILDGSHRVDALRRVGAKSALVHAVEYRDPEVRLFRWCRVVKGADRATIARIVSRLGLEGRGTVGPGQLAGVTDAGLRMIYRGEAFGGRPARLEEELQRVRGFDRIVMEKGWRVEFIDEARVAAAGAARLRGGDLFLIPPRISKEDVLRAAKDRALLPPKSTLHVFPFRALGVNYPVEDLRAGRDILDSLMKSRRAKLIEHPLALQGRGYREVIVVAFD